MISMKSNRLPAWFRVPLRNHNLHQDRHLEGFPATLSDFMSSESRSSYTSFLSTSNATKVFHFDFHCNRLIAGLIALEPISRVPSSPELRAVLKSAIANIVRFSAVPPDTEIQFVVILRWTECEPYLRIHTALVSSVKLDQLRFHSIAVECRKGQRPRPAVKDTSWYCERIAFEKLRSKSTKETILVGESDQGVPVLLEGLITNFFVVTDDLEVWTAADKLVLPGSMRDLVLRACEELNVMVVERAAPLRSWGKYQAAFLTNARRLLQPVSAIEVPNCTRKGHSDIPGIIRLPEVSAAADLVKELRQRVTLIVERTAESILQV